LGLLQPHHILFSKISMIFHQDQHNHHLLQMTKMSILTTTNHHNKSTINPNHCCFTLSTMTSMVLFMENQILKTMITQLHHILKPKPLSLSFLHMRKSKAWSRITSIKQWNFKPPCLTLYQTHPPTKNQKPKTNQPSNQETKTNPFPPTHPHACSHCEQMGESIKMLLHQFQDETRFAFQHVIERLDALSHPNKS
jgi:hypothetical protein